MSEKEFDKNIDRDEYIRTSVRLLQPELQPKPFYIREDRPPPEYHSGRVFGYGVYCGVRVKIADKEKAEEALQWFKAQPEYAQVVDDIKKEKEHRLSSLGELEVLEVKNRMVSTGILIEKVTPENFKEKVLLATTWLIVYYMFHGLEEYEHATPINPETHDEDNDMCCDRIDDEIGKEKAWRYSDEVCCSKPYFDWLKTTHLSRKNYEQHLDECRDALFPGLKAEAEKKALIELKGYGYKLPT